MFKLLIGLLLFFGLMILVAGALGLKFLRSLFGLGNKSPKQSPNDQSQTYSAPESREKVFKKHEGEYVEFKEIEVAEEDIKEKDEQ